MNYEELLRNIALSDEKYIIMTAENRVAIRNLPPVLNHKFIDTGITEQALIGIAAGLALRGRVPVVHALAAFLTMRAFEFIRTDVGYGNLPVKLVGGVPGFLSDANGPTHQAIEDISLMRTIPNMNIFCPADEQDMVIGLGQVITSPSPFYIRYNSFKPVVEHTSDFKIGKAEIVSEGTDATILVYGFLLKEAMEAKNILESKGLSIGLLNLRTVKPIDEETILKCARNSKYLITIEDHFLCGGLFSILSELFQKNHIMANIIPFALENRWFKPALLNEVLEYEGFTGRQISEKILKSIN